MHAFLGLLTVYLLTVSIHLYIILFVKLIYAIVLATSVAILHVLRYHYVEFIFMKFLYSDIQQSVINREYFILEFPFDSDHYWSYCIIVRLSIFMMLLPLEKDHIRLYGGSRT
jgi:hypothetical protein